LSIAPGSVCELSETDLQRPSRAVREIADRQFYDTGIGMGDIILPAIVVICEQDNRGDSSNQEHDAAGDYGDRPGGIALKPRRDACHNSRQLWKHNLGRLSKDANKRPRRLVHFAIPGWRPPGGRLSGAGMFDAYSGVRRIGFGRDDHSLSEVQCRGMQQ
jgi:hypothetical protein